MVFPCYLNGLSVVRSLARHGVRVLAGDYVDRSLGRASRYARQFAKYPDPRRSPEGLVDFLLARRRAWRRAVLIPTHDEEVEILSRHKRTLEEFFIPLVAEPAVVSIAMQKYKTYELCEDLGIPHPRTVRMVAGRSPREARSFPLPCLVRPVCGGEFRARYGGRNALVPATPQQLERYLDEAEAAGLEVMVQELIPGADDTHYAYIGYWDAAHRPVAEFACRKLRQNPPNFGAGRVFVSIRNDQVMGQARRLLAAMDYTGPVEVELKRDARDGLYKVIEINARSIMEMQLAIDSGVDLPWAWYRDVVYGEQSPAPPWRSGVYWVHFAGEVRTVFRGLGQESWSLRDYLRPYLGPRSLPVFALRDLGPVFQDTLGRLWYALRSRLDRRAETPAAAPRQKQTGGPG